LAVAFIARRTPISQHFSAIFLLEIMQLPPPVDHIVTDNVDTVIVTQDLEIAVIG